MTTRTSFILAEKKARETGLPVQVLNAIHPEADIPQPKGGLLFAVRCVEHDAVKGVAKRKDAHVLASHPTEWCAKCRRARTVKERREAKAS